ncbi:hypothetical protein K8I61_05230 [bacterium]|nr:hypothetical protein [bacterium]
MARPFLLLATLALVAAFGATQLFAQAVVEEEKAAVVQTDNFVKFLRASVAAMDAEEKDARQNQDTLRLNCVAPRLADLRRILADTLVNAKALRQAALEQNPDKIESEFLKVQKDKKVAEQLVRLANECYSRIGADGGFTESVERFMGRNINPLGADFGAFERVDMPEPQPPLYEPLPESPATL